MYDEEQQELRKQLAFAESAKDFFNDKQQQLTNSKQQNQCLIAQHDFEQIKSYAIQIKKALPKKQEKKEKATVSTFSSGFEMTINSSKHYACPLIQPNVFGIKPEHNIRLDCDGSTFTKYTIAKHFENYHRMLPECAVRLRDAIVKDQSADKTTLFSENEIILVRIFFRVFFIKLVFFRIKNFLSIVH
jgi:hypothetical protein